MARTSSTTRRFRKLSASIRGGSVTVASAVVMTDSLFLMSELEPDRELRGFPGRPDMNGFRTSPASRSGKLVFIRLELRWGSPSTGEADGSMQSFGAGENAGARLHPEWGNFGQPMQPATHAPYSGSLGLFRFG